MSLIDPNDTVLLVIDAQDYFVRKLHSEHGATVVHRIAWLVQAARWFQIPIIVTVEDLATNGPTAAAIRKVLPKNAPDLDKMTFGLTGQPEILAAVKATGKKTAVLVGLETDVCVQHSALGLAALGYWVAVVVDATASPGIGHEIGIKRMRAAGITLVSSKSLLFEWLRDVPTTARFTLETNLELPAALDLDQERKHRGLIGGP